MARIERWRQKMCTWEHLSEDGLSTGAIVTGEVSALKHELGVCRSRVSG